jgi:hypothetical protein
MKECIVSAGVPTAGEAFRHRTSTAHTVERQHFYCWPWCIASLSAILPLLLLFVDDGASNRSWRRSRRRNRRSTTGAFRNAFPNVLLHSSLYAPRPGRPLTHTPLGGTLEGTVPYGMVIAIHTGIPTVLMAAICRLFQRCLASMIKRTRKEQFHVMAVREPPVGEASSRWKPAGIDAHGDIIWDFDRECTIRYVFHIPYILLGFPLLYQRHVLACFWFSWSCLSTTIISKPQHHREQRQKRKQIDRQTECNFGAVQPRKVLRDTIKGVDRERSSTAGGKRSPTFIPSRIVSLAGPVLLIGVADSVWCRLSLPPPQATKIARITYSCKDNILLQGWGTLNPFSNSSKTRARHRGGPLHH